MPRSNIAAGLLSFVISGAAWAANEGPQSAMVDIAFKCNQAAASAYGLYEKQDAVSVDREQLMRLSLASLDTYEPKVSGSSDLALWSAGKMYAGARKRLTEGSESGRIAGARQMAAAMCSMDLLMLVNGDTTELARMQREAEPASGAK